MEASSQVEITNEVPHRVGMRTSGSALTPRPKFLGTHGSALGGLGKGLALRGLQNGGQRYSRCVAMHVAAR